MALSLALQGSLQHIYIYILISQIVMKIGYTSSNVVPNIQP